MTTIAKGLFVASVLLGALFATSFEGAAQGRAVKQELNSEDESPVSFEASSRDGTKKTFVNILFDSGNT